MSDLISRQAAVERFDYIRPRDPMTNDYTHGIDVGIALCKVAIREQPPAQLGTNLAEVGTDLVSRQAVKDIFTELYGISAIGSVFDKYEWADICETTANELPSVQPERKTGRWIEMSSTNHTYKCSVCGRLLVNITDGKNKVAKNYPYCHCGADMRGEQE